MCDPLYSDLWKLLPSYSVDAKKKYWAKGEIGQEQGRGIHQELLYTQNCMQLERVLEDTTVHDWLVLTHLVDLCS